MMMSIIQQLLHWTLLRRRAPLSLLMLLALTAVVIDSGAFYGAPRSEVSSGRYVAAANYSLDPATIAILTARTSEHSCTRARSASSVYTLNTVALDPRRVSTYCTPTVPSKAGVRVDKTELGTCDIAKTASGAVQKPQITVLECLDIAEYSRQKMTNIQLFGVKVGERGDRRDPAKIKQRYKLMCAVGTVERCEYAKICGADPDIISAICDGPKPRTVEDECELRGGEWSKGRCVNGPSCSGERSVVVGTSCKAWSDLSETECRNRGVWHDGNCVSECPPGSFVVYFPTSGNMHCQRTSESPGSSLKLTTASPYSDADAAVQCARHGGTWHGSQCLPGEPAVAGLGSRAHTTTPLSGQQQTFGVGQSLGLTPPPSAFVPGPILSLPSCSALNTKTKAVERNEPFEITYEVSNAKRVSVVGSKPLKVHQLSAGAATISISRLGPVSITLRLDGRLQTSTCGLLRVNVVTPSPSF